LAACVDRTAATGEWSGERPVALKPGQDPAVAGTLATVRLRIKADGRFELTEEGFGKSGHALSAGRTWRLHIAEILGRPVALYGKEAASMAGVRTVEPLPDGTLRFLRQGYPDLILTRRAH
jgi:hypothetical protein